MKITIPYPITVNNMYVTSRGRNRQGQLVNKQIKTALYKHWVDEAGWEIARQVSGKPRNERRIRGTVRVTISVLRPDRKKRDIDNLAKCVLDLLVRHQIIEDDQMIEQLTLSWRYDGPNGAVVEVMAHDN